MRHRLNMTSHDRHKKERGTRGRRARGEGVHAREAHENRFNTLSGRADISIWLRGSRGKK